MVENHHHNFTLSFEFSQEPVEKPVAQSGSPMAAHSSSAVSEIFS
ncbi:hypothetical protein L579_4224 [Pantoea sp. AS-PWVM4]|nr:hypothetical protein L579_4224 [Pantoea sp. AS-PWVM4]